MKKDVVKFYLLNKRLLGYFGELKKQVTGYSTHLETINVTHAVKECICHMCAHMCIRKRWEDVR